MADKSCWGTLSQEISTKKTEEYIDSASLSALFAKMLRNNYRSFEDLMLHPDLLRGVYDMGFNVPSKFEETILPMLLANPPQNMIAHSQSGTGKTSAFVLAMLSRVDTSKNYVQVVRLSPTYELAKQTGKVAARMSQHLKDIRIRIAVNGDEVIGDRKLTEHIVIGTPGKILDWGLTLKVFNMKKVSVLILDEADVMITTQDHRNQWIRLFKQLPDSCQTILFAATYEQEVMSFAESIVQNPITIRLPRQEQLLHTIRQYYVKCDNQETKYAAISNIYGAISIGQSIIFCQTHTTAMWLSSKMSRDGHSIGILLGDAVVQADAERNTVLDRFRNSEEKVLITTNALRGIDVEQVTIVVNFDMPVDLNGEADCESYLHRIGRTGRFGRFGLAINLIDSAATMKICQVIEEHFGRKMLKLDTENPEETENIQK